ncbi:hypothetical protein [Pseudomonas sp. RIT-PI-S]|uniref:hypothetical protein n=1 Tax=Pseudomonas sp. RIT-PI-S TaxID=3035295 RepID=UPI0021DA2E0E|nr:hypothetical protein [Pseudomonas sp. RIT-PI-S]
MHDKNLEQASLLPAEVPAALPTLPGGPVNVLPVAVLAAPLQVKLPKWPVSGGLVGPRVKICWDGALVHDQQLDRDFDEDDLLFDLQLNLTHGPHQLDYNVTLGNGSVSPGEAVTVTVDRVPPALGTPPAQLVFPPEVGSGVTDDYLQANGDQLSATLPAYGGQAPGDQITWYWDRSLNANEQLGTQWVADLLPPMTLIFSGDAIRARGDGARFVHYRITDYAGNSAQSGTVQLPVRATPVPRVLPVPQAVGATGSGANQTLRAAQAVGGIQIRIPANAVIKPGETAALIFGEPGQVGGVRVPIVGGAGDTLEIGEYEVAAHLDNRVPVRYETTDLQGVVHGSDVLQLTVNESRGLNFPTVQCALVDGSQLSLSRVPATGAPLRLSAWRMMTDYQRLMVRVTGVDRSDGGVDEAVVEGRKIEASELATGVGQNGDLVIPKALLSRLKLNESFYVEAYLSFDGSGRWPAVPTFMSLVPVLVR